MTDDDRMDRARRIREMRTGSGSDEAPDAGAEPADDPDGSSADEAGEDDDRPAEDDEPASGSDGADHDGAEVDEPTIPMAGTEVDDVAVDPQELARQAGLAAGTDETDDVDAGETDGTVGPARADVPGPTTETEEAAGTREQPADAADGATDAADAADEPVGGTGHAAGNAADPQAERGAETRVLEFDLGTERYCLDIEYVEEIVRRDAVTRVPNTPDYVAGVVDLRGQITTILDPTVLLDVEGEGDEELIVVFDPERFEDQGAIGWLVDDVNQVTPVAASAVTDAPTDDDHVTGVVERDGEFVVWTEPRAAIEDAAT